MSMNNHNWLNQMGKPCSVANLALAERAREAGAFLRRRAYRAWYASSRTASADQAWTAANNAAYAAEDRWFLRLSECQQAAQ